jgi:hypothetical protein
VHIVVIAGSTKVLCAFFLVLIHPFVKKNMDDAPNTFVWTHVTHVFELVIE